MVSKYKKHLSTVTFPREDYYVEGVMIAIAKVMMKVVIYRQLIVERIFEDLI